VPDRTPALSQVGTEWTLTLPGVSATLSVNK
jgi:hypothetical protein